MEFKLIIKKLNNTLSQKEALIFDEWYKSSNKHKQYFDKVERNFHKKIDFVDVEKGWIELNNKLKQLPRKQKRKFSWRYAVAVAATVLISLPLVFNKLKTTSVQENSKTVKIIVPGVNKAVLTLENGDQIALEKGQQYSSEKANSNGENLIYEKSKKVNTTKKTNESKKIAYNYLTIPRGGEFFVQLADGTKVWLNSESKLKYPISFIEGQPRVVELIYGEGYFDVSESTKHKGSKFIVRTNVQDVTVLGTEFNIRAYSNEANIYTTLVEGKVAVSNGVLKKVLKPSTQSKVTIKSDKISVRKVDVVNEIAWKNGFFSFEKETLGTMLNTLARWYDIKVVYKNKEKSNLVFSGMLKRTNNVEELLRNIEKTEQVRFEIKNKEIIVK